MPVRQTKTLLRAAALAFAAIVAAGPVRAAETSPSSVATVSEAAAAEGGVLRRLPSIGRDSKLSGESDRLVWPIWVTAAEAALGPKLRLSYVAAVSVMPEASRLDLSVNDQSIGGWRISSGGSARTIDVALPAGALRPGWNTLRIEAEQRHRVECTVPSTYELWTEIDQTRSGLVFPTGYAPDRRSLADIAGIAPDEHGRVHIRLVTPQDPDPAQLRRALRAVQALTIAGGFLDPVVTLTRALDKAPGIDLLIGTAARSLLEGHPQIAPGTVALFDDPDPGRLVVALPDDAAALDRVIDQFLDETGPSAAGSEAGLAARAALGGLAVESGAHLHLADFGATSTEFSGRLFRTALDLRLPADLYAADYAKVIIRLAGGYAPGLERSNRLTVRVNGRQAAGAPLNARQGEVFTDRNIQIPLSAFRPGHNRIEIEASLTHGDDRLCDPAAQIDGTKRFLLVDRTEIVFPTFARVARLPDLAATAAGVLSVVAPGERPTLFVPRPDASTLSATATFVARIAAAAGRVDVPPIVFRNPPPDTPSAIVIGAFADLPVTVAATVGIEPVAIRDAWGRRPPAPQVSDTAPNDRIGRRVSALRHASDVDPLVTGSVQTRVMTAPRSETDLVDRWRRSMESPWSPTAFLRNSGTRIETMVSDLTGRGREPVRFAPRPSTGLVVAQALSPDGGIWTLVTAPTAAALVDGVSALTESGRWNEMEGAVVAWDQIDERTATTGSIQRGFFASRDLDPRNVRLIAAAWVTENPIGFILAVLGATLLLGITTARLLPHLGTKP